MTVAAEPTSEPRTGGARAARVALWVLQVLLALFFVLASGLPKLLGETYAVQIFAEMGVGQWLRYAVGVLEVAGGIGLLVPRLAGLAASGLVALMIGATVAQLTVLTEGFWYTPVIVGLLLAIVVWARRRELAASLRR